MGFPANDLRCYTSRDPEQEYFADGLTEALITNLAKISALHVVSRTSAMQYKGVHKALRDIARELGVDGIVEGTESGAGVGVGVGYTVQLPTPAIHSFPRSARDHTACFLVP